MNKKITIIILSLAITMAVSGCVLRNQKSNIKNQNGAKPDIVNNQIQNQEQSSQIATSTSSENVATSSETIDTSDWNTYKNEDYGLKFNYPKNISVKDWSGYVNDWELFLNIGKNKVMNDGAISIGIFRDVTKFDPEKVFWPIPRKDLTIENVKIGRDGVPAHKVTVSFNSVDGSSNSIVYFFEYSDRQFKVSYNINKSEELDFNIFNKLLQSIILEK